MIRPKSFKDFILGILLISVIGLAAVGIGYLLQGEVTPGDIQVLSGAAEITAQQHITGEEIKTGKDSVIKYEPLNIETEAAGLPAIEMEKGIILEATQDPYSGMYYTMYNEQYEELYYRSVQFHYPEEPGTYYVIIDADWGNRKHVITIQHGFALIIE